MGSAAQQDVTTFLAPKPGLLSNGPTYVHKERAGKKKLFASASYDLDTVMQLTRVRGPEPGCANVDARRDVKKRLLDAQVNNVVDIDVIVEHRLAYAGLFVVHIAFATADARAAAAGRLCSAFPEAEMRPFRKVMVDRFVQFDASKCLNDIGMPVLLECHVHVRKC